MKILNSNGFSINPFMVQKSIALSGLEFHMSLAQLMALDMMAFQTFTVKEKEVLTELNAIPEVMPWNTKHTLCGIPIIVDKKMQDGQIELHLGDQVLSRIENLAIPCDMARNEQHGWNLA